MSVCAASCGPATPITRNHCWFTFTNRPTGSSVPKSDAAAAWPSTATAPASPSASSKNRPDDTCRPEIAAYAGATPYTIGISACGLGSIFSGITRFRGLGAASVSRFASMLRRSWSDRPVESFRTLSSAWLSGDSRASTMTFRTPSCSMKAMTSCWAPAPIDSMATTAPTPKIIPSIVSSERILRERRLSIPCASSGAISCAFWRQPWTMPWTDMRVIAALPAPPQAQTPARPALPPPAARSPLPRDSPAPLRHPPRSPRWPSGSRTGR